MGNSFDALIISLALMVVIFLIYRSVLAKRSREAEAVITEAFKRDPLWDRASIIKLVENVFRKFQNDWSAYNPVSLKEYCTDALMQRMDLEQEVLRVLGRQDVVACREVKRVSFVDASAGRGEDFFAVKISYLGNNSLMDKATGRRIYGTDGRAEAYWKFSRKNDSWMLADKTFSLAAQAADKKIADFSLRNGFYFNPGFGNMLLSNEGVLFKLTNLSLREVENHTIGRYAGRVVELFTCITRPTQTESRTYARFVVAQAVLPKNYSTVLLANKAHFFRLFTSGLVKTNIPVPGVDEHFDIWTSDGGRELAQKLLAGPFLEKVLSLSLGISIEVSGKTVHVFRRDGKSENLNDVLEVLTLAIDQLE